VFQQDSPHQAIALLERWLAWASRSQLPAFVKLARTVRAHKVRIYAAVSHQLTNARVESMNGKLRLIMRRAFGFRSVEALIGMAMLAHGGPMPPAPRQSHNGVIRPTDREEDPYLRPSGHDPWRGHPGRLRMLWSPGRRRLVLVSRARA
jgi:hypothetical protein